MQVDVHVYHLLVHCNMIVWAFDVVIWYVTIRWYQWSSCIACLYWWNFTPSSQTSYAANMLAHGEYSYLSCYPWYVLPAVLQWTYACRYNVHGVIWSGLMTLFRMLHSNMIMFQYASTPFVLYNVVTIELENCFDLVENVVVCTPVYIQEPHKWRVSCCCWLPQRLLNVSMLTVPCCRYIGRLNRLDAENYLEGMRDGTYLVRQSEAKSDYTHAICIRYGSQYNDHMTFYLYCLLCCFLWHV